MPVRMLPTFKGYTVDHRLRQFRFLQFDWALEFIDFDSPCGQQLLAELRQEGYTTPPFVLMDEGDWVPVASEEDESGI
jgi:hypothetical protein